MRIDLGKSWRQRVLLGGVVVLLLLTTLFASRQLLLPPLLAGMINRHLQELGLSLTLGAVSGNLFSTLNLDQVELRARQPHLLQEARVERIALHFNLLAWRHGREAFLAGSRIRLVKPDCTLNLALSPPATAGGETAWLPAASLLPQLAVSAGRLRLNSGERESELSAITLQTGKITGSPARLPLTLAVGKILLRSPERPELLTRFQGELALTPDTLQIDSFQLGDHFLSGQGELALERRGARELNGRLALNLAGVGDATLTATMKGGLLTAGISGQELPLAAILAAAGRTGLELDGKLSGSAQLQCQLAPLANCRGAGELLLAGGHWRQLALDRLELQGGVDSQALTLRQARLTSGSDLATITGATLPLAALVTLDYNELLRQGRGNFELNLHHLPQLLNRAGLGLDPLPAPPPEHTLELTGSFQENTVTIARGSLQLHPGQISLPAFRLSLPPPPAPLSELELQGELLADLPDLSLLSRVLALPPLQGKLEASAQVSGSWRQLKGQARVKASRLAYGGRMLGDLTASGEADRKQLRLESFSLTNGSDHLQGQLTIPLDNWQASRGQLNLTVGELASYDELWPRARGVTGGLKVELTWRGGSLRQPNGEARIQGHHLAYTGIPAGELRATLVGANGLLSWPELTLERGGDRFASQGRLQLANLEFGETLIHGRIGELGGYLQAILPPDYCLSGPVQFTAQARGKLADPRLALQLQGEELLLHGNRIDRLLLNATLHRQRLEVEELRLFVRESELSGRGWLTPDSGGGFQAELSQLTLKREQWQLQLSAPAHLELDPRRHWWLEPMLFTATPGSLQISGQGTGSGWQIKGMAHNLASHGWLELLTGDPLAFSGLEADFELLSTPEGPRLACQGNLAELNFDRQSTLSGNFDLTFDPQGFSFRKFSWQTQDGLQLYLNGHLPFNPWAPDPFLPGPLTLDATVNLPSLQALAALLPEKYLQAGAVQATTNLSGTWGQPMGHLAFSGKKLLLAGSFQELHPLPLTLAGSLDFEGETIRLRELELFSELLELHLAGLCTGLPAANELLRGRVAAMRGELELSGKLTVPEIAKLGFTIPGIRRFGGRLTSELAIHGPLPAPVIHNQLTLGEGFLRPDWDLPAFNELKISARLDWPALKIQALQGEFGGAPFTIDGSIDCQDPRDPKAALHLLGDNLLIYRQPGLKLRGNAEVELSGPLSALKLAGEVAITNSSFTEDVNYINLLLGSHRPKQGKGVELFSIKDKPFRDMAFDLKFTAKNPIRIKNNMASGGFRPNVKLLGTGELPVLAGDFFLDRTRVTLPTGQFTFESGLMRFPAGKPDRQLLDLTGTAQLLGYDVAVQIHGPYSDSVVTLTSNPSLPQEDLLLLVLTGKAPAQNLGSAVAQKSGMKVALYLGRNMLSKWFGGGGSDTDQSILDRFELEIGRGLTQLGEDTIESRFRLASGVFRDDDVLFLNAEKDTYDAVNAGVKIVFRFP